MSETAVYGVLAAAGVCGACCLRHLGHRNPHSYAKVDEIVAKFTKKPSQPLPATDSANADNLGTDTAKADHSVTDSANADHSATDSANVDNLATDSANADHSATGSANVDHSATDSANANHSATNGDHKDDAGEQSSNGGAHSTGAADDDGPAVKRRKLQVCVCCLGLLQRETWDDCLSKVKETLLKRGYDCKTFACALSAPNSLILREKSLALHLQNKFPALKVNLTPLKEAWKWSVGPVLEAAIGKTLDSGSVSPLLITVNMEYDKDSEELETLKSISPASYAQSHRHNRYPIDFSRRSVESVVESVADSLAVAKWFGVPPPRAELSARCVSVQCSHAPVYLAGRYIKLSRQLSQTPWLVDGKRMMESSVSEVICEPIAKFYRIPPEDMDRRVKLIAAGREDVDVRCLGTGRPFCIEISDPHVAGPSREILNGLSAEISGSGTVRVRRLDVVTRDELAVLKQGEESKAKTYTALCIKLPRGVNNEDKENPASPTRVTNEDIASIGSYRDPAAPSDCRVVLQQKTPLRVLHRRPLHTRPRKILDLSAKKVQGHANLFTLAVRTEAGTYIKEFVHGDFGRTRPCLRDIIGSDCDILALDVTSVDLEWPIKK